MQIEILFRPSFSMTRIQLGPDEEIRVEGGAMVSMSDGITSKNQDARRAIAVNGPVSIRRRVVLYAHL